MEGMKLVQQCNTELAFTCGPYFQVVHINTTIHGLVMYQNWETCHLGMGYGILLKDAYTVDTGYEPQITVCVFPKSKVIKQGIGFKNTTTAFNI